MIQEIKIKSLAYIEHDNKIFVSKDIDSSTGIQFYRPIGGTVEFGEQTKDTLIREVKEELNTDIDIISLKSITENIFQLNNKPYHEIVYIYNAGFKDKNFYKDMTYRLIEDNGTILEAIWVPISEFKSNAMRLVPEKLLELI